MTDLGAVLEPDRAAVMLVHFALVGDLDAIGETLELVSDRYAALVGALHYSVQQLNTRAFPSEHPSVMTRRILTEYARMDVEVGEQ